MSRPPRTALRLGTVAGLVGIALTACSANWSSDRDDAQAALEANSPVARVTTGRVPAGIPGDGPVKVVAVGDIVCPPGREPTPKQCQQRRTAQLAERIDPDAVLALGDLQYQAGALSAFRSAYDASWGRLRSRTYPVPGNHEYRTAGAEGYYTYFRNRQPGPPGWYAVNLGSWRAYLLNSQCDQVDCDAQAAWLKEDLAQRPRQCSLIVSHDPRFSSGEHGNSASIGRFFRIAYRNGVDLFLSGHDHHSERFVRLAPDGTRSPRGVMQFVSGSGGKSLYPQGTVKAGSAWRRFDRFGVLQLSLRDGGYGFSFRGIGGSTADRGDRSCV